MGVNRENNQEEITRKATFNKIMATMLTKNRKEKNLKIVELKKNSNFSEKVVNALEKNRRNIRLGTLLRLCDGLGITLGQFLEYEIKEKAEIQLSYDQLHNFIVDEKKRNDGTCKECKKEVEKSEYADFTTHALNCISINLVNLRNEKKLKQRDIKEKTGINLARYRSYERGSCYIPLIDLVQICDFYRINPDELLQKSKIR